MGLDNRLIADLVGLGLVGGYIRLVAGRLFEKLNDLAKGVGAGLVMQNQQLQVLTDATRQAPAATLPTASAVVHSVISVANGEVNQRFEGTDADYPYKLWKELETGVPGQHWMMQDGSVIGYLEN